MMNVAFAMAMVSLMEHVTVKEMLKTVPVLVEVMLI